MTEDILRKPAFTASHVATTVILALAMVLYVVEAGAERDLKIQSNTEQTESVTKQQKIINKHNDEFRKDVRKGLKDLNETMTQILIKQG